MTSATRVVRSVGLGVGRGLATVAGVLRPGAPSRPPWERTVLDDIAMRRPWNLRLKWARRRALLRRRSPGTTVVVVNWNTRDVVGDVIHAVQRRSPPDTRILVVDNGSVDGSPEMLRTWDGIDTLLLPENAGHGVALDLAMCVVDTQVAVTLDSDAVPLTDDWLAPIVDPVQAGRAVLAGQRSRRGFVHPIYAAVDVEPFLRRRLSWQVHRRCQDQLDVWGENAWDTGELLSARLAPDKVAYVERTENPVAGLPGMTAGGVVYHHGGVSRSTDGGVSAEALTEWRRACAALGVPLRPGCAGHEAAG